MGGTPLSIGSGDMNTFKLQMRITERFTQPLRILQTGLKGFRPDPVKDGQPAVQIVDCFLILHKKKNGRRVAMKPSERAHNLALTTYFDLIINVIVPVETGGAEDDFGTSRKRCTALRYTSTTAGLTVLCT